MAIRRGRFLRPCAVYVAVAAAATATATAAVSNTR